MNRSWFRNPFAARQDADDEDEPALDDSGVLSSGSNGHGKSSSTGNRRRRKRSNKDSSARSDATASSSTSAHSDASTSTLTGVEMLHDYGSRSDVPPLSAYDLRTAYVLPTKASSRRPEQYRQQHASHAHATSLHSISSIRTNHFTIHSLQQDVQPQSAIPSNGTSTEVSPSRTPLRDRLDRLSWASTASGMIGFDDDDREEAEKRWQEEKEITGNEGTNALGHDAAWNGLVQSASSLHLGGGDRNDIYNMSFPQAMEGSSMSFTGQSSDVSVDCRLLGSPSRPIPKSRSSASLKSILKRSLAGCGDATTEVMLGTPVRSVTFSPSTLPPAASPPHILTSPQHPRPEGIIMLETGPYVPARPESPPRHSYVEDSALLDTNESTEIEQALLSKSSISLLNAAGRAASEARQTTTSQHPSEQPEPVHRRSEVVGSITMPLDMQSSRLGVSTLFDTSAPRQLLQDMTGMTEDPSHLQMSQGPRPLLLAENLKASSELARSGGFNTEAPPLKRSFAQMVNNDITVSKGSKSTSPPLSPIQQRDVVAGQAADAPRITPSAHGQEVLVESVHSRRTILRRDPAITLSNDAGSLLTTPTLSKRRKSLDEFGRIQELEVMVIAREHDTSCESQDGKSAYFTPIADKSRDVAQIMPVPMPVPMLHASYPPDVSTAMVVTPSSSSSSLTRSLNPDSPFSSLLQHLMQAQDDLLSNRTNQKTLLLSLVANLRGELSSRDRAINALDKQRIAAEQRFSLAVKERDEEREILAHRLEEAMSEVEATKTRIKDEIKRRDESLQGQLEAEKRKSQDLQSQLQRAKVEAHIVERVKALEEQLRSQMQQNEALQAQSASMERDHARLRQAKDDADVHRSELDRKVLSLQESIAEERNLRGNLESQLADAEVQISRSTASRERQIQSLQDQYDQARADIQRMQSDLDDANHALLRERDEHTQQSNHSKAMHADLLQERDYLQTTIHALRDQVQRAEAALLAMKKDSLQMLQDREERITTLETEIFRRSADRRSASHSQCLACTEHEDRSAFLEAEVIRLREATSRMRTESTDREVKIARIRKERDQLQEDKEGLNIALEAKQQQILMLKRDLNRYSNDALASTARPATRILRTRPVSIQDSSVSVASSASTAPQSTHMNTASLSQTSRVGQVHRRISLAMLESDTPSVHGAALLSQAALRGRQAGTATHTQPRSVAQRHGQTAPIDTQTRALRAASLMKSPDRVQLGHAQEYNKENMKHPIPGIAVQAVQKLSELPLPPRHSVTERAAADRRALYA